jgi:L-alanine-DL-glutamate epimerase-like enolase superfamily enzyme
MVEAVKIRGMSAPIDTRKLPLAVGEVFNRIWDCKQLIEEQLIDYIRTTVVHAGGAPISPSIDSRMAR